MTQVGQLLQQASKLSRASRTKLVTSLLEGLDSTPHHVSDAEAQHRLDELKSGKVTGLSETEFWKACGRH